ncbi:hypothetical protein LTR10_010208 [Elasticomyces elasticus]|nr:hypothetical protein LTR10_010208 [Elasticomyces elasticus]KAK4972112.1 hypothetical protein LTR42_006618 [Elasticomyces elasticus]
MPPATITLPTAAPARAVFEQAVQLVKAQQPDNPTIDTWLQNKFTIEDIYSIVAEVERKYSNRPKSRARKWLTKFAAGVSYYGKVMDMLVQHHPEYVSLIWGTTKLMFVLVQNHEEILTELAKSMARMGAALPRVTIHLDLFPVPAMRKAVHDIYEAIITHLQDTLEFYQHGRLKKAWKAFIQPYSLRFQDHVVRIEACSREIESLAIALGHQGIREMYGAMLKLQARVHSLESGISSNHQSTYDLLQKMNQEFSAHHALSSTHYLITKDMRTAQMIEAAKGDTFGEPMETMSFRLAFGKRHIRNRPVDLGYVWNMPALNRWSSQPSSAVLIIRGSMSARPESIIVGTTLANHVRNAGVFVLWAFQSTPARQAVRTSGITLLKYLAMQTLKLNADAFANTASPAFNHTRIAAASTEEHWIHILASALVGVRDVYIVVDLDVLQTADDGSVETHQLVTSLQRLIRACPLTAIKIALISLRRTFSFRAQPYGWDELDITRASINRGGNSRSARAKQWYRGQNRRKACTPPVAFRPLLNA